MKYNDIELFSQEDLEKYEELEKKFSTNKSTERYSNDMSYLSTKDKRQELFEELFPGVGVD